MEIPKNIVEIKFKRLVYNQFNPEACKFNNINSYIKIVNSFFQFISIFFFVIIVGSNKKKTKSKYDIIIDDIDNFRQIKKFSKLIKNFNNTLIILNNGKIKKQISKFSNTKIIDSRYFFPVKILSTKLIFNFLSFILETFIFSLKEKQNFIFFYKKIFLSVLKMNRYLINIHQTI